MDGVILICTPDYSKLFLFKIKVKLEEQLENF